MIKHCTEGKKGRKEEWKKEKRKEGNMKKKTEGEDRWEAAWKENFSGNFVLRMMLILWCDLAASENPCVTQKRLCGTASLEVGCSEEKVHLRSSGSIFHTYSIMEREKKAYLFKFE